MKKSIILITVLLLSSGYLFAQKKSYDVVFDITSKDTVDHKMVLRWINEILSVNPNANIEVVFYSKSLDMINKDKSTVSEAVIEVAKKPNVTLRVCEVAMKNNNVDRSQLLAGVGTVPDGIFELVSKQKDGWGYIKVSH